LIDLLPDQVTALDGTADSERRRAHQLGVKPWRRLIFAISPMPMCRVFGRHMSPAATSRSAGLV
jgi:hypothetical protein